jgi:hypothetical protein
MRGKRSSSTRTLQNNTELGPGICPKSPKHTRIYLDLMLVCCSDPAVVKIQ